MNINPIFHRVLKSEEDEALTNPFSVLSGKPLTRLLSVRQSAEKPEIMKNNKMHLGPFYR